MTARHRRQCPVCGARISINGRTIDGRVIGSCGDAFLPRSGVERGEAGITTDNGPLVIHEAATAGLVQCRLCDAGFRRVNGLHVGSQRLGMIPSALCERVFATCGEDAATARPWLAHVDGEPLRKRGGEARRFASAAAAHAAARRASPRRWHT